MKRQQRWYTLRKRGGGGDQDTFNNHYRSPRRESTIWTTPLPPTRGAMHPLPPKAAPGRFFVQICGNEVSWWVGEVSVCLRHGAVATA